MLSNDEVKKIADLARLNLTDKEIEKYKKDISEILDYIKNLSEIDVSNVEPLYNITGSFNIFRKDEVDKIFDNREENREKYLKQAPQRDKNYFKVKKVL